MRWKSGRAKAEVIAGTAPQYRILAQGLRAQFQNATEAGTREELNGMVQHHERMAANLERGWPANG